MKVKKIKGPATGFSVLLRDIRSLQTGVHYPRLVEKLQTDLSETGDATLKRLIAEASEDRRITGVIFAQAKRLKDEVQTDWDEQMGSWMIKGRKALADLKKKKEWEGQIYTADVDRWILANISESMALKKKLREADEILGTAKSIYQAYEYRLSALQSYAKLREIKIKADLEDFGPKGRRK